ncbi:hypothetical protein DevBK_02915 [Devosia sp. BK]|jgi:hypothetical protein|uniref:hypothetical protein n=1 Tax=unclassified Devosia TaxID=196773 RepID=UPI000713322B|nr:MULTISPECIES: hypothetical protein [unclassified Devosia]KQN70018.1 hypothetical protein ASE94_13115 [Devosia sp. Leaf64]KQT44665.1 hypothetical protein ASG47_14530 [Devosia sp. Leaf420]MDV3250279.1 hypothetical protein [Devosia sp. BK]
MASISTISQMSRYEQMKYYREKRTAALAQVQSMSSQATGLMTVKLSESQGMGNLAAKIAYQRGVKKTA